MNDKANSAKRRVIVTLLVLTAVSALVVQTPGKGRDGQGDAAAGERWEYLVVGAPSGTNFAPSGNPSMRKDGSGGFGREAFVLEQQMDKLGNRGWELVSVYGPTSDPAYFFKRRK
jgi:hypothetical protein